MSLCRGSSRPPMQHATLRIHARLGHCGPHARVAKTQAALCDKSIEVHGACRSARRVLHKLAACHDAAVVPHAAQVPHAECARLDEPGRRSECSVALMAAIPEAKATASFPPSSEAICEAIPNCKKGEGCLSSANCGILTSTGSPHAEIQHVGTLHRRVNLPFAQAANALGCLSA
eukprot:21700-Pleurochrysis_carterae.AAC.1